jgi:hypothetical protein
MEPAKLEDHIKKTLKEREIKPSEGAWDKVRGQISQDFKPKRTGYYRYGIAAGFIGILLLSVLYNTTAEVDLDQEIQTITQPSTPIVGIEKEELLKAPLSEEENSVIAVESFEVAEENSTLEARKESKREIVIPGDDQLVKTAENQNKVPEDPNGQIDAKLAELLAVVTTHEENNKELTDIEVDSLLRQAQKEILTEKLINSDKSVNPEDLLSQVEVELDQSFRDKILEKLKSGYNKVRTAVADRNN